MNRRELIQVGGAAVILSPFLQLGCRRPDNTSRLFFDPATAAAVRANAHSPRLSATLSRWTTDSADSVRERIERVLVNGDLLSDFSTSLTAIFEQCIVFLVEQSEQAAQLVEVGLDVINGLTEWDYMRDGDADVLGLMRASKALTCTLLSLQVLGDRVDPVRRTELLRGVAEKGCVPCDRTISHMDTPSLARGWGVASGYTDRVQVDMSRWPVILGNNNLRAIPTMGLGLGALALSGIDDRSDVWLNRAIGSSKTYLALHEADGSYFEGISYLDFAFRSVFQFFDAYDRIHGDIDWTRYANFHGISEYITCLQNGQKDDRTPDIINISDARESVHTCVPAWIAQRTGDTLAQYAADHFSLPGFYADFLWYNPELPSKPPENQLRNKHFDLDWIVCRTGWQPDDTVVAFRSGGPTNHEHADRNSIVVKSHGERLLTDPLGASYNPKDPFWLLRLTAAHNAILIDGEGHQYHNGEEGTNAGMASATVVEFVDDGEIVHWTSDATQGYKMVNGNVTRVDRSVLFVKPGFIAIVDRVESAIPVQVEARFHPDNRDGMATVDLLAPTAFTIGRPNARLDCRFSATAPAVCRESFLDLPQDGGVFPFVGIECGPATSTTLLTVMQINDVSGDGNPLQLDRNNDNGWTVRTAANLIQIRADEELPSFAVTE